MSTPEPSLEQQPIDQAELPADIIETPVVITAKRSRKWLIVIVIMVLCVFGAAAAVLVYKPFNIASITQKNSSTPIPTPTPPNDKLLKPLDIASVQPKLVIDTRDQKVYTIDLNGQNRQPANFINFDNGYGSNMYIVGGSRQCLYYFKDNNVHRSLIDGTSDNQVTSFPEQLFTGQTTKPDNLTLGNATKTPTRVLGTTGTTAARIGLLMVNHDCSQAVISFNNKVGDTSLPASALYLIAPEKFDQPQLLDDQDRYQAIAYDTSNIAHFITKDNSGSSYIKFDGQTSLYKLDGTKIVQENTLSNNTTTATFGKYIKEMTASKLFITMQYNDLQTPQATTQPALYDAKANNITTISTPRKTNSINSASLQPGGKYVAYSLTSSTTDGYSYNQLYLYNVATAKQEKVNIGGEQLRLNYNGPLWVSDQEFIIHTGQPRGNVFDGDIKTCSTVYLSCRTIYSKADFNFYGHNP